LPCLSLNDSLKTIYSTPEDKQGKTRLFLAFSTVFSYTVGIWKGPKYDISSVFLAAGKNLRFEEIAMAKKKKRTAKRKTTATDTDNKSEAKVLDEWLRMADKPLRSRK